MYVWRHDRRFDAAYPIERRHEIRKYVCMYVGMYGMCFTCLCMYVRVYNKYEKNQYDVCMASWRCMYGEECMLPALAARNHSPTYICMYVCVQHVCLHIACMSVWYGDVLLL